MAMLSDELAQLNVQIEQARQRQAVLEGELRAVEAEVETFSAERQRFDALREVCNALDRLGALNANELFWDGVAEPRNGAGPLEQAKSRVARFDGEISGVLENRAALQEQINRCLDEQEILFDEVRQAHAREERRQDEYVIEREISPLPDRVLIMPWAKESESERRYRRALLVALLFCIVTGTVIPLWKLPVPDRTAVVVVPERLVSMLKKERPKAEPHSEKRKAEKKTEKHHEKTAKVHLDARPRAAVADAPEARKKAESTGVLAFRESFSDLIEETPVARLGAEARLNDQAAVAAGQAQASRSLVAMQAGGGGSGGIGNAAVSRNVGSGNGGGGGPGGTGRLGGDQVGVGQVKSALAGLAAKEERPLSAGAGPARTDEEIQILFDRYKAALYRIYNTELRKDPTLRGKMVLRLTIEPGGEVSACSVDSSNINSTELTTQVVARVKKINFGPKDGVPQTTILYPIDFLPAG